MKMLTCRMIAVYGAAVSCLAMPLPAFPEDLQTKTIMHNPPDIGCDAGGGDTCHIDARLDAEPGFVICKVLGSNGGGRSSNRTFSMEGPMPNDPQNPPRYKSAHWWGSADSSNGVAGAGGWTSNANWNGMGIVEISSASSVQQRWDNNCDLKHY